MNFLKFQGILWFFLLLIHSFPLYADFGSHFEVNSRVALPLDKSDKKIAFRFTCREDMNVIALAVHCGKAQLPPAYEASLQEDDKGKPSGKPLEVSSLVPKGDGWVTFPMNPIQLFGGRVYHLVIDSDINRGGHHPVGVIDPDHFASFSYTSPLHLFLPVKEDPDRASNVLLFDKGSWKELDRQPLYAIYGAGQKTQGNPYDDFGSLPIHGNGTAKDPSDDVLQGASLHPHAGMNPKGFALRVRKRGNPVAPLNMRIYSIQYQSHKTSLAYSGKALDPGEVTTDFRWVTLGPQKLKGEGSLTFPPECRYVVFQTDSGRALDGPEGCSDCYELSDVGNSGGLAGAAEMSFDGGPHLSRAVHSNDGWATWVDEYERDAHVILLAPPSPPIKIPQIDPVPTPSSPWSSLDP